MEINILEGVASGVLQSLLILLISIISGRLWAKFRSVSSESNYLKEGIKALLRDNILTLHNVVNQRGYVTVRELESLDYMYRSYHALGGNGFVDELVADIHRKDIKSNGG